MAAERERGAGEVEEERSCLPGSECEVVGSSGVKMEPVCVLLTHLLLRPKEST